MSQELYQELILEHARRPHNATPLTDARSTREHNPLCGDSLTLFVRLKNSPDGTPLAEQLAAVTTGCALSKASASIMTDILRGKTVNQINELVDAFAKAARGEQVDVPQDLEPLTSVAGYPARVKCVTMSWHAAKKLLEDQ